MNRNMVNCAIIAIAIFGAAEGFAGPVTTVPWNGHPGAATFTFDDGMASQVTTLMPALRSRKINATMYIYNSAGWQMGSVKAGFIAGSKAGDEIANHTQTHPSAPPTDATKLTNEIVNWAGTLRAADPSIEAVTFGYPYCLTNDAMKNVVNQENFIARNCASSTPYTWTTSNEPTWMSMQSMYVVQGDSTEIKVNAALDNAKKKRLDHHVDARCQWKQQQHARLGCVPVA